MSKATENTNVSASSEGTTPTKAKGIEVRVRALPKNGFWRGGLFWTQEPIETTVSKKVLEAISNEPMLNVVEL